MKKSFALCLVAASAAFSAQAGRYWSGSSSREPLWSDTANWSTASGGATGATIPGSGTGTTYFRNYLNGSAVIDGAYTIPDHLRIDTKDERPFVWSATDPANGLTSSSGKDLRICEDGAKSPAYLQIDSGTYSFSYLRVGYADNANAGLIVNGGAVSFADVRIADKKGVDGYLKIRGGTMTATGSFLCSDISGTTSLVEIDGGTLDTTNISTVRIGRSSDSEATFRVKSGIWNAKAFMVGGDGSTKTDYGYSNVTARLIVDGGTLTAAKDSYIGNTSGENAVNEMIVNGGDTTINALLYVGDGGPGILTMNGGNLTVTSSDYGITIGHAKTGKDRGTLNLNGGTLSVAKLRVEYAQAGSVVNFNGTTLKPRKATSGFLDASANLLCNIQTGGLIIDTDYDITIAHDLVGVGGIVKKGAGKLTLTGTNAYAGGISFDGETSGSVVENAVTYTASNPKPAAGEAAGLDVSAGGLVAANVVVHGEPLESWLKDSDFTTYSSKYGAQGRATLELPTPFTVHNGAEEKTYTNLKTGTTYTDTLGGTEFSFTTEALAPRTLQLDRPAGGTVHNVRDVGSWPLVGGRKMNQNVILRGGHLDAYVSASAEQRAANWLTTAFGLKTEIDLRTPGLDGEMPDAVKNLANGDASYSATNAKYYRFPLGWGESDGTQIGADANGNFTNQVHNFFSTLGTEGRLPAYFHCRIGTDRTGIMGMLLLAVMGVEEEVLYRDYLMSNFADIGGSRDPSIPRNFLRYLHRGNCNGGKYVYDNNNYGLSVAARARAYLEMCGVTTEELGRITAALSGETPDEVLARVNTYEQANGCRTVSYVNYVGSSTTNEVHRLPAGTNMLPASDPTRSGYTFKGWDTANEVDNGDGTATVYAIWEENLTPFTYQWDNAADNNVFSDGGNWKRKDSDPVVHAKPTAIDNAEVTMSAAHPVLSTDEELEVAELYIGRNSSNYPVLDIEGGKLKVNKVTNLGRYGERSEVNLRSGEFETKGLVIGNWGSHEYNVFNMYGGTLIAAQRSGWPSDAITLGLQTESKGILNVYGGEVYAQANVHVSFAGMESNIMGNKSVLNVDGGLMSVTGSVIVATDAKHACGQVLVKKGRLEATGDLNICNTSNSWGEVEIAGGEVAIGGTIRVGNHEHAQHAVLKVAGGTLEAGSVSVARQCSATLYITDGGIVRAGDISKAQGAPASASPSAVIDNGTIVFTKGYDYNLASFEHISFGEGGATFDTAGFDSKIQAYAEITGLGGITKKGEGKLELVANSFGFAGTYAARGPIVVEEGTLGMPSGQTIYCTGTNVAEGATLDLHGSTLVMVTKKVVRSVWTNAAGDADATNPLNWTSDVVFFDENGEEIPEIAQTLEGVLPTTDSVVRIPVETVYPENVGELDVAALQKVASDDVSLIAECGASYDSYAVDGTVVIAGDNVKVLNSFNALLHSAVAWYDPSDLDSLTLDEEAEGVDEEAEETEETDKIKRVTAIANKGTAGSSLDLRPMGDTNETITLPAMNTAPGWKLPAIQFIKDATRGFKSDYVDAFNGDRTLVVVDRHTDNDEWYPFLFNNSDTFGWNGPSELWGSKFRYQIVPSVDWGESLACGDSTGNKDTIRSFRVNSNVVSGEIFYADTGTLATASTSEAVDLNNSNMRLCMGERNFWNGSSKGGFVGEAMAFDKALSDNAVAAVRQYLQCKWLDEESGEIQLSPTSFDALILEDATVDFDGAAVVAGVLGGSGEVTNAESFTVTSGLSLALTAQGTAPKMTIACPVVITGTVLEADEALLQTLESSNAVVVLEAPSITCRSRQLRMTNAKGHKYVLVRRVAANGNAVLTLERDTGFAISVR